MSRPVLVTSVSVLLGIVGIVFGALQGSSEAVTLRQALDARKAEYESLRAEVTRLAEQTAKAHDEFGPFHDTTTGLRRKTGAVHWRSLDVQNERLQLLALLVRLGKNPQERQPLERWLSRAEGKTSNLVVPAFRPAPDDYDYRLIDKHARETPPNVTTSIPKLADYLKKGAKNDREKLRAAFIWVAENIAYDWDNVPKGPASSRADQVLKVRTAHCGGYSALFDALERSMGLKAAAVGGSIRSLDVPPNMASFTTVTNGMPYVLHGWNAVLLDGKWWFVDPTYGTGRFQTSGKVSVKAATNPEYFLVPPGQLAYTHFPTDPRWQLLDRPLTTKEQVELPLLSPGAFRHGIQFWPSDGPALTAQDSLVIRARAPKGTQMLGALKQNGNLLPADHILVQRDPETGETDLYVVLPKAGKYVLQVGVRTDSPTWTPAIEYQLEAKGGKGKQARLAQVTALFEEKGAFLDEPLTGVLAAGRKQTFAIRVPGATSVAVFVGKKPVLLEGKDGLFRGTVALEAGEVFIGAAFPDRPDNFEGLVLYKAE